MPLSTACRGKSRAGRVFLKVWKDGNSVIISVADTGLGMDEETLEELVTALKNSHTAKVGIGLGNIYQRIQTMYQNGGLRIYSKKGRGTVIQMTIPQEEI